MALSTVRVRFATNRNRLGDADPRMFGEDFLDPAHPESYVTGSIDVVRRSDDPDLGWVPNPASLVIDARRPALVSTVASAGGQTAATGAVAFVQEQAAAQARGRRSFGLVLIHGFAASFIVSMSRAAQIASAYGAQGVFSFSWPANEADSLAGYIRNYPLDKTDATASGLAIADALAQLIAEAGSSGPRLSIVAHSMGAFAFRNALQAIKGAHPELLRNPVFEEGCLMAADEDLWSLEDENKLAPVTRLCRRVNVYWSGGDLALGVSRFFNSEPRVGLSGPFEFRRRELPGNVVSIDCTSVSQDGHFEHQYYRLSRFVIADIAQVLRGGQPDRLPDYDAHAPDHAWRIPRFAEDLREVKEALTHVQAMNLALASPPSAAAAAITALATGGPAKPARNAPGRAPRAAAATAALAKAAPAKPPAAKRATKKRAPRGGGA